MIFVGMDDTDNAEQGGTGRVARQIAEALRAEGWLVRGVSRHQLLVDPRVPYTSNNSSNVIHLAGAAGAADQARALAYWVAPRLLSLCLPGSDPGLCVAGEAVRSHSWGRAAQTELLAQNDALRVADELGVVLQPLGGTGDGVVGALAGCILAAGGNDGRFVELGILRTLDGRQQVSTLLGAGVEAVVASDGQPVPSGWVDTCGGRLRPVLRGGAAVLLVEPDPMGEWRVVEQGRPRPKREQLPA